MEASPELRLHTIERARFVRRIFAIAAAVLLLAGAVWAVWGIWSIRRASASAQTPMRADRAAFRRLDPDNVELTLLVVRGAPGTPVPQVALLRQPENTNGSWVIALPAAHVPGSDAASETPALLLDRGRASLIRAVEGLFNSKVGHYVELDEGRLARALADGRLTDASENASSSAPIAGLAAVAERYDAARAGTLALLRVPALARSLTGAVVSDMGATQLDALIRRLGTDFAHGQVRSVVVPVGSPGGTPLMSASAARTLAGQMMTGRPFTATKAAVENVAPGSLTVNIQNGAGREGVAAQAARILRRDGYRVKDVGNANQFVYDKTLVVYKDRRAPAESVARDLGIGKVVSSRGMYGFDTDVLVIVGSDWPQAP